MDLNPNWTRYSYDGPVEEFGKCIAHRWTASTCAPSEKKARSNLIFQFKRDHNRVPYSKITLPGKIVVIEREESA